MSELETDRDDEDEVPGAIEEEDGPDVEGHRWVAGAERLADPGKASKASKAA